MDMISGSAARRYAKALMGLGTELGNYERIGREVRSLAKAIASSPDLAQTLSNPVFPRSERERVLTAVLSRVGAAQEVVNFTRLLLDRERISQLPEIARELDVLIDEKAGRIAAEVTSAVPLTPAQEQGLLQKLEALSGKKVQMKVATDPALLGGLVAKLGDVVYDGSLRTQLERMRDELAS
jgi:F-type H+-transporting ATPase subunit delta